ncbi:hypothetical protein TNCV_649331 [Trichonephila clavipes]|nr:hypothetical protein TNCV_649331 [Trichonephila clavipes]
MIACFVEENHDNWDRFLYEFSFALRTAVNETPGKTSAELFLGLKTITPFRKLVLVTDSAEDVGGNIEKLFDEAMPNMQRQHKMLNSEKSRRSRKPSRNENKSCKSDEGNAGLEDLRVKHDRAAESTGISERCRFKEPRLSEEQRNTGIDSLPQKQPQEKEPQCGSIRGRSGRQEHTKKSEQHKRMEVKPQQLYVPNCNEISCYTHQTVPRKNTRNHNGDTMPFYSSNLACKIHGFMSLTPYFQPPSCVKSWNRDSSFPATRF